MANEELAAGLASKVILIVDDQNSMRSVVKSYFRDMGFDKVETAIDGQDGLNYLMRHPVDLLICDWQMPKVSGIDLLKILRASPDFANFPFLMMTSTSDLKAVKDAVASGVSDYMVKPFKPAQLGFKVVQLLTKSTHKAKRLPVDVTKISDAEESTNEALTNHNNKDDDFDGAPVEVESIV